LVAVTKARDDVAASSRRRPRLVLKVAPDLSEPELLDVADVVRQGSIDGVIVSNTTTRRPASLKDGKSHHFYSYHKLFADSAAPVNTSETGGLSGPPLKPYALAALRLLRAHMPADVPLIGCGGIATGEDALEYGRAGAALVQVYTALGYGGAGTCRRIKDELAAALEREGTTWERVVREALASTAPSARSRESLAARGGPERPLVKDRDKAGEGPVDRGGRWLALNEPDVEAAVVAPPPL
jgi:dihydroorotate dehydrogenase